MPPTIDIDFDSGSAVVGAGTTISADGTSIRITPWRSITDATEWWWYAVRVTGVLGKTPVVKIPRAGYINSINTAGRVQYGWWTATPEVLDSWRPFGQSWADASNITMQDSVPFDGDTIYIAHHPMVPTWMTAARVASWRQSPFVSAPSGAADSVLWTMPAGISANDRTAPALPVYALKVSDPRAPLDGSPKRWAALVATVHPGETGADVQVFGAMDVLLANDARGERLRRKFNWLIFPSIDPAARYLGRTRNGSLGEAGDLSNWIGSDVAQNTCADRVKAVIQAECGNDLAVWFDYHTYTVGGGVTPAGKHGINDGIVRGIEAAWHAKVQARLPEYSVLIFAFSGGTFLSAYRWADASCDRGHLAICGSPEVGSKPEDTPAVWRAKATAELDAIDELVQEGQFGAPAGAPAVTSDVQHAPTLGGPWTDIATDLPGAAAVVADLPVGARLLRVRGRSALGDVSAWSAPLALTLAAPVTYEWAHRAAAGDPRSVIALPAGSTGVPVDAIPTGAQLLSVRAVQGAEVSAWHEVAVTIQSAATLHDVEHAPVGQDTWAPLATDLAVGPLAVSTLPDGARRVRVRGRRGAETSAWAERTLTVAPTAPSAGVLRRRGR